MEAIRCDKLTRAFGHVTAVDRLDLSVEEGEIFGLVGPDGAGKTTTMRLLASILGPTSGDAWVLGRHVVREAEAVKEQIGYMSQRFGLYGDLTLSENMEFYADIYSVPRRERREREERLFAFSNLAPFKRRLAGNLSGGMKQKLGLCCALIHTPRVLFLDEPTNGVDPVSRRDFWRILYQLLREKVTIFVSTAYLDEAERCSRVGLIHNGRLLAAGTPDEVKRMARGRIVEVRFALTAARGQSHTAGQSPVRRAAAALRERLGEARVGLFGDRLHLLCDDPLATCDEARRILSDAGFAIHSSREIDPSLEDVFVSVLTEEATHPQISQMTQISGNSRKQRIGECDDAEEPADGHPLKPPSA